MEFGNPVKLANGQYFLKIKTPNLQVNKVTLSSDLTSGEANIKLPEKILTAVSSLDAQILRQAITSKMEWFQKSLEDNVIEGAYQGSVSDGVLTAGLAKVKGAVVTQAYDTSKQIVPLADVKSGATVDVLVELAGLWFLKKNFGPVWRIVQVRVSAQAKPKFPTEYLFGDDAEEEQADDPADYMD